ncbi:MAG: dipicolinate synthase subunit B [Carboxydocellales bacterium]
MTVKGKKIGFALTGSHCTLDEIVPQIQALVQAGAEIYPIFSTTVDLTDTRFGTAQKWKDAIKNCTNQAIISTIVGAEPIGPQKMLDVLVVAPCTGNTIAKLANGITDTPVLMAVKAHLRNQRPVVLAVSTNDGLSMNAQNIGLLLNSKNVYMVPFGQDNPQGKPNSLVANMSKIQETIEVAIEGKQIQPLLLA